MLCTCFSQYDQLPMELGLSFKAHVLVMVHEKKITYLKFRNLDCRREEEVEEDKF